MQLIFMGTPEFAVPSLERLVADGHDIRAVITQPDRPKGRGLELVGSAVKQAALKLGLPLIQPVKVGSIASDLVRLEPEVIVTVAFGQKLPSTLLDMPARGCINLHASLLPRYRGAAPIHWAIIRGEGRTGVSTMYMDQGLDTGDIILQRETIIDDKDTAGTLHDRLALIGAQLLSETLELIKRGEAPRIPQDEALATWAPTLTSADEIIDWTQRAEDIYNRVRGLNPWPGARTLFRGENLRVWWARVGKTGVCVGKAGEIVGVSAIEGLEIAAGSGTIILEEVQPAGRRRMNAADYIRGYHPLLHEVVGR